MAIARSAAAGPQRMPAAAWPGPIASAQMTPQAAGTASHSRRHRLALLTASNAAARMSVSGANKTPATTATTAAAASSSLRRGVPSGTR